MKGLPGRTSRAGASGASCTPRLEQAESAEPRDECLRQPGRSAAIPLQGRQLERSNGWSVRDNTLTFQRSGAAHQMGRVSDIRFGTNAGERRRTLTPSRTRKLLEFST